MGTHRRDEVIDFSGAHILTEQGALSQKHEHVAEIIKDYDPDLELAYIPKQERSAFDAHPFAVVHVKDGYRYVVMTCREDEVDERLLTKLFLANTDRHDVLKRLEAEETAKRLMEMRQRMDELDAKKEFRDAVIQSRKNWYRHKGKVYS
jgi:hypothetical protein